MEIGTGSVETSTEINKQSITPLIPTMHRYSLKKARTGISTTDWQQTSSDLQLQMARTHRDLMKKLKPKPEENRFLNMRGHATEESFQARRARFSKTPFMISADKAFAKHPRVELKQPAGQSGRMGLGYSEEPPPPPEVPKSQRVIKLVQKFKNDQEKRRFDKAARLHMKTILDSIEAKTYNFRNIDNDIQNVLTNYPSDSHIGHKLGTLLFNMAISNPDDQVKTTDVYKFMQGKALINMYPLFNEVEDTVYEWFDKAGQKTDIFEQMPEEVAKIKAALVMAVQQMKTERGKAYGDTEQPEAYLRILKLLPALKKALEHEYKGTYSKRK